MSTDPRQGRADPQDDTTDDFVRDSYGRPMQDLRISLLDRCNFRCPYCMPEAEYSEDYEFLAPRFAGHVRLGSARSTLLAAGQTATVRVRSQHESIGSHVYRLVAQWIDDKFRQHMLASSPFFS